MDSVQSKCYQNIEYCYYDSRYSDSFITSISDSFFASTTEFYLGIGLHRRAVSVYSVKYSFIPGQQSLRSPYSYAPSIRSHRGTKVVWTDFQPMIVPEEPVCIRRFRQNQVFTSLHLKSPVNVVPHLVPVVSRTYILNFLFS